MVFDNTVKAISAKADLLFIKNENVFLIEALEDGKYVSHFDVEAKKKIEAWISEPFDVAIGDYLDCIGTMKDGTAVFKIEH